MTHWQLFNRSTSEIYRLSNLVIVSFQAAYLKMILSIFLSVVLIVNLVRGDSEVLWWVEDTRL